MKSLIESLLCIALGFAVTAATFILVGESTKRPAPLPAADPVVAELLAEIAAREAELDALATALDTTRAERDEAVAKLGSMQKP